MISHHSFIDSSSQWTGLGMKELCDVKCSTRHEMNRIAPLVDTYHVLCLVSFIHPA